MRRRAWLAGIAGLLGAATAVLPTLASGASSTASFTAVDYSWNVTGGSGNQATIAPGGSVAFSYPAGASMHNADFGTGPQPSSCTQTSGLSSGSVPPLPHQPTGAGWSGTCSFNTPGTYTFHCDLHPSMTGTIIVQGTSSTTTPSGSTASGSTSGTTSGTTGTTGTGSGSGTTTTSSSTPSTTANGSSTTSAGSPAGGGQGTTSAPASGSGGSSAPEQGGSPAAGGPRVAILIAGKQRGAILRGEVTVPAADRGGRLRIELWQPAAGRGRRSRQATAGAVQLTLSRTGHISIAVPLNAPARRALHRYKHLALVVKLTLVPPHGAPSQASRKVVLSA